MQRYTKSLPDLPARGTYLEETYFSFSYSPVLDESGRVGGLFCPSTDVTAKNLNARRLHTLSSLAALLKLNGHAVLTAADAVSVLKLVEHTVPGIVILDLDLDLGLGLGLGLPGMDGYELAAELRRKTALRRMQLIALSGYGQEADQRRSADPGFAAHLIKPVDMRRLEALLETAYGVTRSVPSSGPD